MFYALHKPRRWGNSFMLYTNKDIRGKCVMLYTNQDNKGKCFYALHKPRQ